MAQLIYNEQVGQYWNPQTNNFMKFGYQPTGQDEVLTQSQYDEKYVTPQSPNFGSMDYWGKREARLRAQGYTQFQGDPRDEYYGYHPARGWEMVGDYKPGDKGAFKDFLTLGATALGGAYLLGPGLGLVGGGEAAGGAAAAGGTAAGGAGAAEAALSTATPFTGAGAAGATSGIGTGAAATGAAALGTGAALMPAATPEADPTFGGELTQTAPGAYENVGNVSAFGAPAASALGAGALGTQALSASSGGSSGGGSSGGGAGGAATGGTLMDSWLNDDTWQQMLLRGLPAGLGAIGAYNQSRDFKDLANQYSQMGAPYRSRLESLYQNPQAFLNSPEVTAPIQQGTNMLANSLSIKGNPAGSGNALQELQNYTSTQLFNRLGQEKDRLAGFGGLTQYNSAAPQMAQAQLGSQKGIYDALGAGAADIFNPPKRYSLQDLLRAY